MSMLVSTFLSIATRLPASVSILLRGNHGIGKSQMGRQLARLIAKRESLKKFPVIDRRLSQMSEGDMIGLPSTDGEVTRFNPPDWYKKACIEPCFLFLDELNRATPEVMQAAFQIVLDRELNGWKLHPQTRVMSAVNASAAYNVNEIDPALLDRFWVIDLTPDEKDWLKWAGEECLDPDPEVQKIKQKFGGINCLPLVREFLSNSELSTKWLDPPQQSEPGKVHVSRRSWERLGDAIAFADIADDVLAGSNIDDLYAISTGFVGTEAAGAFKDWVKTAEFRFTGKDIAERYSEVRNRVTSKKKAELFNDAIEKVSKYISAFDSMTERQGKNLQDFMSDLPAEQRLSLWTKLTAAGVDKVELAKSVQKYLVKYVLDVFNVPLGEAGVGVIPNIPGIFNKSASKGTK